MAPFNHCKHMPAVSWLLATRYVASSMPGTVAQLRTMSVFLRVIGTLIQPVVLTAMCASPSRTAPDPIAAVCRSGAPVTTLTSGPNPRSAATDGCTTPMTVPNFCRGASFSTPPPASSTSTGS